MNTFLLLIFAAIIIIFFRFAASNPQGATRDLSNDAVKGYQIHVTPDVRTRLKILKLRGKSFETSDEAKRFDFEPHEAIVLAETASWAEMGIDLPEMDTGEIWTDIGSMKENKVEDYYRYLEKFREVVEDDSIEPKEKVKKIRAIPESNRYLRRLAKLYGKGFPKHMFISELTNIDGISIGIALQLFDKNIFTMNDLIKLDKKRLLKLRGVGEKRANSIIETVSS